MFKRRPKLPIADTERAWVDASLVRLDELLGRGRMMSVEVVLPTNEFFPDLYQPTLAGARLMANRVAYYIGLSQNAFEVHLYAEGEEAWKTDVPFWSGETRDANGLFFLKPDGTRFTVGLHHNQLKDPFALVATIVHELAHVILLGGGLLQRDEPEMELLTDLATVIMGFGVFNSGAAYRFVQWTDGRSQGWSTSRSGYLNEELWGYSLAKFAQIRGEAEPIWRAALVENVRVYFDQSVRWLRAIHM